ncbi:beta-ketoacyl-[acyl-carrier-protein] synthase family protein [Gorillibacterium massiliense]|uniref:beta-ketoacyl-[acyl-carrier-protein] synthase family protein n=1 Tax=Gorillibacterium massiliense TaxID=1280390 RepID=UPI0005942AF4|nr:beta-ketoacyl synthase N-terminal-like domain-containing protein [Gorillibacterium massiliense]
MRHDDDSIVITGMGTISAAGMGAEQLLQLLESGRFSRVGLHERMDLGGMQVWGSPVESYQPQELLGKRGLQFLRPSTKYLMGAALLALRDAGLAEEMPHPERLGIVVGSNFAGMEMVAEYDRIAITEGPRNVSPAEAPNTLANSPASHLAIRIQSKAANSTIATGQCAGLDALGYAANLLKQHRADCIVVGGVEELNPRILWLQEHSGVLPAECWEAGGKPFDGQSTGWIPGEGGAVVVLERRSDALKRGATLRAELIGWGSSFAPAADGSPQAKGLIRAIRQSLQISGLDTPDIQGIFSGANGYIPQDAAEAEAFAALLGKADVPATAVKGTLGEMYGASGIFQCIAALGAMERNTLPPTIGVEDQHGAVHLSAKPQEWSLSHGAAALLTAQDLCGSASAVLIGRA